MNEVEAIEGFAEKYRQAKLDTDLEVVQEMKHAMSAANEEEKAMSRKPSATGSSSILGDSSNNGDHGPLTMNEEDERKEGDSQEKVEGDEEKAQQSDAAAAATESPALSDGGQTLGSASADVLLPLLIFTIVKSNPTNFLSNLRFIHRFRRPSRILGQESYCLTNMVSCYFSKWVCGSNICITTTDGSCIIFGDDKSSWSWSISRQGFKVNNGLRVGVFISEICVHSYP